MSYSSSASVSRIRIIGSGVEGRTENHFTQPRGICIDQKMKELFVVDCNNHRICVFSLVSLAFIRQIGRGVQGSGPGHLNYAVGACLDFKNHHIYVADTNNHRVSVFDQFTGAFIRCIGYHGSGQGELNSPYGVCIDSGTGNLFVTDYDNHRVQVFDTVSREYLRTIGKGQGSGPGQMNQPIVPYLDEETGFLYIADYSNNRVQIFDKDTGVYIRQIGGGGIGGSMTGLGADSLNGPRGICIDNRSGLLFISDRENHRIKVYDKSTFVFLRFLGNGLGSAPGQFHRPMELCISADDCSLCVVDGYNHRVQLIILPELQTLKNREILSSRMRRKKRITSSVIRPSKISIQADISLLRIKSSNIIENYDNKDDDDGIHTNITDDVKIINHNINNNRILLNRINLSFPFIGSHITVPITDVNHLIKLGFFAETTNSVIASTPQSQFLQSSNSPSSSSSSSINYIDNNVTTSNSNINSTNSVNLLELNSTFNSSQNEKMVKIKHAKKLNYQANVFMSLIMNIVNDNYNEELNFMNNLSENNDIQESHCDNNEQNDREIFSNNSITDHNLMIPSVFALNALLEHSWQPDDHVPDIVIKSLVYLMCHDDTEICTVISYYERKRVIAASSALLIAIVNISKKSSEIVFGNLLKELRSFEAAFTISDLNVTTSTWNNNKNENKIHPDMSNLVEDMSDKKIYVLAPGIDRNNSRMLVRGGQDGEDRGVQENSREKISNSSYNNNNDSNNDYCYENMNKEDEEVLMALKLLALILSNMSSSTHPYPSSSLATGIYTDIVTSSSTTASISASASGLSTDISQLQPKSSILNVNTSNQNSKSCDDMNNDKTNNSSSNNNNNNNSSNNDNYNKDIQILVFGQYWMNNHKYESFGSSSSKSNISSNGAICGREERNVSVYGIKHSGTSVAIPSHSPQSSLNAEFLDLMDGVSKINKIRQLIVNNEINVRPAHSKGEVRGERDNEGEVDDDLYHIQLELLQRANKCFSQASQYKKSSKVALKASQGGRHIWQLGQPLVVGDLVDARDREKSWFESYVTEVRTSVSSSNISSSGSNHDNSNGNGDNGREREKEKVRYDVKVHYMGWGSKWDDWVSDWDLESRIAPLNSKSKNWRADLFEGGLIEIKCNEDLVNQKWMWGKIIALDYEEGWVDVSYTFTNEPTVIRRANLYGETLCMVGMHTKDKSKLAAASIIRPERRVEDLLKSKFNNKKLISPVEDFMFCDLEDSFNFDEEDSYVINEMSRGGLEPYSEKNVFPNQGREKGSGVNIITSRSFLQLYPTVSMPVQILRKKCIKNILPSECIECISSIAFNSIMREILDIMFEYLFCSESISAYSRSDSSQLDINEESNLGISPKMEKSLNAAIEVLRTIAGSTSRHVLVPYFCRVLTVQCGLRAKLIVQNELLGDGALLRVDLSSNPLTSLLDRLNRLGDNYCALLIKCFVSNNKSNNNHNTNGNSDSSGNQCCTRNDVYHYLPLSQLQHAARRIKSTVTKCAVGPLARKVFQKIDSKCSLSSSPSPVNCFSRALTMTLLNETRFSIESTNMRRLLNNLINSSSESDLDYLEKVWTETVTSWIVRAIHDTPSTYNYRINSELGNDGNRNDNDRNIDNKRNRKSNSNKNKNIKTNNCDDDINININNRSQCNVNYSFDTANNQNKDNWYASLLIRLLSMRCKAKSISKLEFSSTNRCARSADIALNKAFELVSEEDRNSILKTLVISIDESVANSCTYTNPNRPCRPRTNSSGYLNSTEDLIEFLQIIITEKNSEYFESYYQLLLAHRLLGIRHQDNINEIDGDNNENCNNSNGFNNDNYSYRNSDRRESNPSLERSLLLQLPVISRAEYMIQDVEETYDRMSDFRQYLLNRIDNNELDYPLPSSLVLSIKPNALNVHILSNASWPMTFLSPISYSKLKLPKGLSLMVDEFELYYQDSNKETISYIDKLKYDDTYSLKNNNNRAYCTGNKKLLWCHGLGTVTLCCRIQQNKLSRSTYVFYNSSTLVPSVTLIVSTPQAVVLLAFESKSIVVTDKVILKQNKDKDKVERSFSELIDITGLEYDELQKIVLSLCHHTLPLLSKSKNKHDKDIYYLSEALLNGSLGGMKDDESLVPHTVGTDRTINVLSKKLLHTWRNNMIDACIVRTLKVVCRDGLSEFIDQKGCKLNTTISVFNLCEIIKRNLETKSLLVLLLSEEIIERCNNLVERGIIDVIKGFPFASSKELSLGYSYLPENSSTGYSSSTFSSSSSFLITNTQTTKEIATNDNQICRLEKALPCGKKLFCQLCDILCVKNQGTNVDIEYENVRISKQYFVKSFTNWLTTMKFNTMNSMNAKYIHSHSTPNTLDKDREELYSFRVSPSSSESSRIDYERKSRGGEKKDGAYFQSVRASEISPLRYRNKFLATDLQGNENYAFNILKKKLICVYQASLEQIDRLKHQHLRAFGLDNNSVFHDAMNMQNERHPLHLLNDANDNNHDDIFYINRTSVESLPEHLIRLILKVFYAIQEEEDPLVEDYANSSAITDNINKGTRRDDSTDVYDHAYGLTETESNTEVTSMCELKSEGVSPSRINSLQETVIECECISISATTAHSSHDDQTSQIPRGPSNRNKHGTYEAYGIETMSKDELKHHIRNFWDTPVKIFQNTIDSLLLLSHVTEQHCQEVGMDRERNRGRNVSHPLSQSPSSFQSKMKTNKSALFLTLLLNRIIVRDKNRSLLGESIQPLFQEFLPSKSESAELIFFNSNRDSNIIMNVNTVNRAGRLSPGLKNTDNDLSTNFLSEFNFNRSTNNEFGSNFTAEPKEFSFNTGKECSTYQEKRTLFTKITLNEFILIALNTHRKSGGYIDERNFGELNQGRSFSTHDKSPEMNMEAKEDVEKKNLSSSDDRTDDLNYSYYQNQSQGIINVRDSRVKERSTHRSRDWKIRNKSVNSNSPSFVREGTSSEDQNSPKPWGSVEPRTTPDPTITPTKDAFNHFWVADKVEVVNSRYADRSLLIDSRSKSKSNSDSNANSSDDNSYVFATSNAITHGNINTITTSSNYILFRQTDRVPNDILTQQTAISPHKSPSRGYSNRSERNPTDMYRDTQRVGRKYDSKEDSNDYSLKSASYIDKESGIISSFTDIKTRGIRSNFSSSNPHSLQLDNMSMSCPLNDPDNNILKSKEKVKNLIPNSPNLGLSTSPPLLSCRYPSPSPSPSNFRNLINDAEEGLSSSTPRKGDEKRNKNRNDCKNRNGDDDENENENENKSNDENKNDNENEKYLNGPRENVIREHSKSVYKSSENLLTNFGGHRKECSEEYSGEESLQEMVNICMEWNEKTLQDVFDFFPINCKNNFQFTSCVNNKCDGKDEGKEQKQEQEEIDTQNLKKYMSRTKHMENISMTLLNNVAEYNGKKSNDMEVKRLKKKDSNHVSANSASLQPTLSLMNDRKKNYGEAVGDCYDILDINEDNYLTLDDFIDDDIDGENNQNEIVEKEMGENDLKKVDEEEGGREEKEEKIGKNMINSDDVDSNTRIKFDMNLLNPNQPGVATGISTNLSSVDNLISIRNDEEAHNSNMNVLSRTINQLVRSLCTVLNYDTSLSDEILRLLIEYNWDIDHLTDSLTFNTNENSSMLSNCQRFCMLGSSYRCLSRVLKKIRYNRIKHHGEFVQCLCGVRTSVDSMYSLKGCNHWYCRNCWIGVINNSLSSQHTNHGRCSTATMNSSSRYGSDSKAGHYITPNSETLHRSRSTGGSSLSEDIAWSCPGLTCNNIIRCGLQMRGDFISHLCNSEGPRVKQLFYYSQLSSCAHMLLSQSSRSGSKNSHQDGLCANNLKMGEGVTTEAPATAAMMSWWRKTVINTTSDRGGIKGTLCNSIDISKNGSKNGIIDINMNEMHTNTSSSDRKSYSINTIQAHHREISLRSDDPETYEYQNSNSRNLPNLFQPQQKSSVDAYERLLLTLGTADIHHKDLKLNAEYADDSPLATRYQMLSDRYFLLSQVISLLAHTHIMVAAETVHNDIREMEIQAGGIIRRSIGSGHLLPHSITKVTEQFGAGWSDITGLYLSLQSVEVLTVIYADTLLRAVELIDQDSTHQTQTTSIQLRIMTSTLRKMKSKLLKNTDITLIQKEDESSEYSTELKEKEFGISPFSF